MVHIVKTCEAFYSIINIRILIFDIVPRLFCFQIKHSPVRIKIMVAPPMHGSKLDKIVAELFFIKVCYFLFLLNISSQIFDLADQLGRLSSCGSSSSGHHTCHSFGCTKVWLCWMMISLKSFLLNIQNFFFKKTQFRSYIYMSDTRNISDYLLLYSWFFSTAIYRFWKQNFQFSPLH